MEQSSQSTKPPFLLHIVAIAFIICFLMNLAGIIQVVESWNWLLAAGYFPHPVWTVLKGAFVGLSSLVTAVFLWVRFPFAPRLAQVVAGLVFASYWIGRLALTSNPLPFSAHLFPLLLSLFLLIFIFLSAWLLEPFMKRDEQGADAEKEDLGGYGE
ncbi:MAG TPA: hypothetical protein PLV27_03835 [Anaerolineaceae bacterium]|nr:hypothetical protein [Anaerolineaceae bacterium]